MATVTERRRGVCNSDECGGRITTWLQGLVTTRWGRRLVAECVGCGRRITQ